MMMSSPLLRQTPMSSVKTTAALMETCDRLGSQQLPNARQHRSSQNLSSATTGDCLFSTRFSARRHGFTGSGLFGRLTIAAFFSKRTL